jgi:hypothetical protein
MLELLTWFNGVERKAIHTVRYTLQFEQRSCDSAQAGSKDECRHY